MTRFAMSMRVFGLWVGLCAGLWAGLAAAPATAMLIATGDGSGNTEPPNWPSYLQPGFEYVGTRGSLSAVYLGEGWVITANHVGAGNVVIDGVSYPWVPGSARRVENPDGTNADLLLFEIDPHPDLPNLPIAEESPAFERFLMIMGNGRDRGAEITWDPNGPSPPGLSTGYEWAPTRSLRWGSNYVEVYPMGGSVFNTVAFGSRFDASAPLEECQAVTGDSGGGVFVWEVSTGRFVLAGLVLAIEEFSNQPAATSIHGQSTYYADLAYYRDDILEVTNLPEPSEGLGIGAALLVALRRRRNRAMAASR